MAKGQMLPPGSGAPVEVTREYVQQEEARRAAAAAGTGESSTPRAKKGQALVPPQNPADDALVPHADLPSPTAPLSEIVAGCERIILAARIEFEEAERKAVSAWLGKVGPAVRLVHSKKAYKEITDLRGKPYRSFAKWAQERCGISRAHAYRMVNEKPVADALAVGNLYSGPLATRQVDVLAPVLRQHGEEEMRRLWRTADAAGGTGMAQLVAARDSLGLGVKPEEHEPPKAEPAAPTALARVQKVAQGIDRDVLRKAALEDPDGARRAVTAAQRFAEELQAVLAEVEAGEQSE